MSLVLAVAVAVLAPGRALAGRGYATEADGDDARGPLDVKRLHLVRPTSWSPLHVVVTFYRRVPSKVFARGGHAHLGFDTQGDAGADWTGTVTRTRRGLTLIVRGRGGEWGRERVARPTPRELAVTLPGSTPPNPNGPVAVTAKTSYKRPRGPCRHACTDRAPDGGGLAI